MVHSLNPEGRPPPVCCCHSHQEKASGSTARPPVGEPYRTVALACTWLVRTPSAGAKKLVAVVVAATCTRPEPAVVVVCGVPVLRLLTAIVCAVVEADPQMPRAQSCATASAPASAPACSC